MLSAVSFKAVSENPFGIVSSLPCAGADSINRKIGSLAGMQCSDDIALHPPIFLIDAAPWRIGDGDSSLRGFVQTRKKEARLPSSRQAARSRLVPDEASRSVDFSLGAACGRPDSRAVPTQPGDASRAEGTSATGHQPPAPEGAAVRGPSCGTFRGTHSCRSRKVKYFSCLQSGRDRNQFEPPGRFPCGSRCLRASLCSPTSASHRRRCTCIYWACLRQPSRAHWVSPTRPWSKRYAGVADFDP